MKPRTPQRFVIAPATHSTTGKPCVVLDFGKLGRIALEADDVERFKAELDEQLRAAAAMGGDVRRWPLFAAFGFAFGGGAFLGGQLWPIGAAMIGLGFLMGWLESRR